MTDDVNELKKQISEIYHCASKLNMYSVFGKNDLQRITTELRELKETVNSACSEAERLNCKMT